MKYNIDVVWTWCGLPESEHCRYSEDLKYSIRSVAQNIPWYNRIFIVVQDDFQVPFWMKKKFPEKVKNKIQIVRIRDIIPRKYLPTNNSHVIQSYVYRIKGLSEHFVFLTDDMYVGRPTLPSDFFDPATGAPVNRHYPGPPDHSIAQTDHRIPYVRMWVNAILKHKIHHTRIQHQILPYRKSLIQKYAAIYKQELHKGSLQRHRSGEHDFNLLRFTTSLTTQNKEGIRLATDDPDWRVVINKRNTKVTDYFVESPDIPGVTQILKLKPKFFNINNSSYIYTHIYHVLDKLFPAPSPFERPMP